MKMNLILIVLLCVAQSLSAQTWIRQNPFPRLVQIMDVDFDGQNGLAVGEESTIFTTANGGTTWKPQKPPIDNALYDAPLIVPGTNGELMFIGGFQLIVSRDGGLTWEVAHNGIGRVHKIQVLSNGTIMAHGAESSVLTQDEGASWEVIPMPDDNTTAADFTSELHGWVHSGSFNNGQVWVTTDGGGSWNLRDTLKHPVISSIDMLTDQVGFLGSRDFVYKTTDGGHTWEQMHNDAVNSIQDMHVVNENEIWTCLHNGFIFYTLNGGTFWQNINPNIINSNKTNGIYANDEGKVWAAGKYVSIIYSDNYGDDWIDQIPNAKGTMYRPYFYNENIGIVGSSEGTLLKTTNGGASWDQIQFAEDENFFAVSMVNQQTMLAGSSSGRVFGSSDQGNNWTMIGQNLGQIKDMHAFNLQTGVVISESAKIYRTENAGLQWDEVFSGAGDLLTGVDFTDALNGWVCGWFGQVLHTSDGGKTWLSQNYNGYSQFSDIDFTSPQEGWIVSSGFTDTIWHTMNGGLTWETSLLPYKIYWHGVSFTNPDTGWVVGGSAGFGTIFRTNDGGQTWLPDHQSPEALFGIHALPQKETAWVTGFGGNILKYSPCTFNLQLGPLDGNLTPCQRDTIQYTVESSEVDIFEWTYPSDWLVFGNPNTSSIQLIAGLMPGQISVKGKDACDNETEVLSLTVAPIGVPDVIIEEDNGVLTCNLGSGFYQWLLNGIPVPGANQQSYVPVAGGTYEIVVTTFATGCEVRSNALQVILSSINSIDNKSLIIFPNPVKDILNIAFADGKSLPDDASIQLISADGMQKETIGKYGGHLNISMLPAGIYFILIKSGDRLYQTKFMVCP